MPATPTDGTQAPPFTAPGLLALSLLGLGCAAPDAVNSERRDTIVVQTRDTVRSDSLILGAILEITPTRLTITAGKPYATRETYTRDGVLHVGLDTTHCKEEYDRAAMQWNRTASAPTRSRDTIFVKQPDRDGVYTEQHGTVIDVTLEDLTLLNDSTGVGTIYARGIVRRVGLDDAHCKELQDQVASYWNKTKSRLVGSVQRLPVVGTYLGFLDGLPGGLDFFLATLLLLAVLGYGAYRAYETLIVARGIRDLNLMKLRMEVDKLRYEVDAVVKERVGTPTGPAVADSNTQQSARPWRLPEIHGMEFLRYKVMRLPSQEETQARTEDWRDRWKSYRAKQAWLPGVMYAWWRFLNGTATVTVAFLGLGAVVDMALPLTAPQEFAGSFSVGVMLMFAGLGVLCLSGFLRLKARGKMIKATYREFRRTP